jgi:ATP/maltotriose-dependent transcriptional regulator MalT
MMAAMTRERPALPLDGNVMATLEAQGMAPRDRAGLVAPPLLATKLAIPTPAPTLVDRPRLTARLQTAAYSRLALVVAPAGSGKSSVVSQWCHEQAPGRVAWLSLDADDNEPRRFLQYLCAALERVVPDVAAPVRALLHAGEERIDRDSGQRRPGIRAAGGGPGQPMPSDEVLTLLLNGLAALDHPVTLVLDDYHEIESFAVHQMVAFLLEHLPPTLSLILVSRSDPLLPLARLRARGQLVELRTRDLRFTLAEARLFLNESMGLAVDAEVVERLAERTEGWIAGLQLAALSLQGDPDPGEFVAAFTGSHRHIVDYLFEELLRRQPADVQAFLGQTAFLERLSGPLCEAVTGTSEGQAMLERLEAASLFLIPLDTERRWYRYHQLFADVLQARLQAQYADQIATLQERAAAWYEAEGLPGEAMEYALAGGHVEQAASLIEREYERMLRYSEQPTLGRWLQALPAALIQSRPVLSLLLADAQCHQLRIAEAQKVLDECRVETMESTPEAQDVRGKVLSLRGFIAGVQGNRERAIAWSREALGLLSAGSLLWRMRALWTLAGEGGESEDLDRAAAALQEVISDFERSDSPMILLRASYLYGQLRESQGALGEAERCYRAAREYARERRLLHAPAAGLISAGLGRISYQRNDLPGALKQIDEALERTTAESGGTDTPYAFSCYFEMLRVMTALGDTGGPDALLTQLATAARGAAAPFLEPVVAALRVRRPGVAAADVAAWLTTFEARTQGGTLPSQTIQGSLVPDVVSLEILTWARLRLTQGQTSLVLTRLERFLEAMVRQGRHGSALPVRVLLASLYWQAHRRERAAAVLEPALALAEREGCTRVFLEAGGSLIPVLRYCAAQGIAPEWSRHLLAVLSEQDPFTSELYEGGAPALVEPLSSRELEVLRLAAEGLSNQAIAGQLFLSAGTVKCHLHQVYGKLAATSRFSAVARARELHML